ncbi:MAG: DMT family transporter [Dongiaceae bacterium]
MMRTLTRSPDTLPSLVVALVALFWGCWWIPLRMIDAQGVNGPWAGAAIYLVAALALLPVAVAKGWFKGGNAGATIGIGIVYGVQLSTFSVGIVVGEVLRVMLLCYLLPIWGTLFAFVLLGEKPTVRRLIAVGLGLGGAAVILNEGGLPLPRSLGDWLGLATGIIFALATALSRKRPDVGGLASTFVTFAAAATACAIIALFIQAAPDRANVVAALPLIVTFAVALAIPSYALVIWSAGRIDPGRLSVLLLLEIVAAAISAAMLLDEPFGGREIAGCVLIIAAGACSGQDQMGRQPPLQDPAALP